MELMSARGKKERKKEKRFLGSLWGTRKREGERVSDGCC